MCIYCDSTMTVLKHEYSSLPVVSSSLSISELISQYNSADFFCMTGLNWWKSPQMMMLMPPQGFVPVSPGLLCWEMRLKWWTFLWTSSEIPLKIHWWWDIPCCSKSMPTGRFCAHLAFLLDLWWTWTMQGVSSPQLKKLKCQCMHPCLTSLVRCRWDIIPILSPPLRRRFRPQKPGFHHKTLLLSLIPFLPGSHSLRKYYHWILLVSTILTTPHMSGSVHCRRSYGSCRFFSFTHSIPPPNTADLRQFFESRDIPHISG